MPRRRWVLRGVGTACLTWLAGCAGFGGGSDSDNEDDEDEVNGEDDEDEVETGDATTVTEQRGRTGPRTLKQGVLMPLSGALGELGKPIRDGALLPMETLRGRTDFTIDVQVEDTQTDPDAGRTAANRLVDAGHPAVTGPASSEVTLQVARNVFVPNGVVGCSPSATSPAVTDLRDDDLIWRTPPTDRLQGRALAQVARRRANATTASTMHVDNSYGQLLSRSFASAFEDRGGRVQAQVPFPKSASSYRAELNRALSGDPDVLVVVGYPESGTRILRDYYAAYPGDRPILVTDGLRDETLPTDVGNAMQNVTGLAPLAAGPGEEYFRDQYEMAYDRPPGVFTSQAFDATAVCLLASAAAGRNEGPAIAAQMRRIANPGGETITPSTLADGLAAAASGEAIQYQGASSVVDFDENGDLEAATYELFGFERGGGIRTIDEIRFSG